MSSKCTLIFKINTFCLNNSTSTRVLCVIVIGLFLTTLVQFQVKG